MTIMIPKRVVLDSCAIADTARDVEDPRSPGHNDALAFLRLFTSHEWIPMLSLLQINEIAQHGDPHVVEQRVRLLQRLPLIAWIRNTRPDPLCPETLHYGAVLDLIYHEAMALLAGTSAAGLRDDCVIVAASSSFVASMVACARESRRRLGSDQKARNVASLAFAMGTISPKWTIGQLRDLLTNDRATIARNMRSFRNRMVTVLEKNRDPKANGLPRAFADECAETELLAAKLVHLGPDADVLAAYLQHYGLGLSDVDDSMTMQEVGELAGMRAVLRQVFEGRAKGIREGEYLKLRPHMIPSYWVDRLLRRKQVAKGENPKGSDLIDASTLSMALYAEVAIVDKRTHELVQRIRREHPDLDRSLCRIVKWSGASKTLNALNAIA